MTALNERQFLSTSRKPSGGEDKPTTLKDLGSTRNLEPHKCNIKLGNEALDSYHRKSCSEHGS